MIKKFIILFFLGMFLFPSSVLACGSAIEKNKSEISSKKQLKNCCKKTSEKNKGCSKKCKNTNCQCPTSNCTSFINRILTFEFNLNTPQVNHDNFKNTLSVIENPSISIWSPPKIN
ncbi:hypothetical protein [Flavobacterium sp. H122]|uniref:hypothetical protein n=1 Tax=Flavobacterium sp. H122 TaxID=2529860 RepID=UPI00145BCB57|nr:hypothetical protein [Flavobacterium sp. H122]